MQQGICHLSLYQFRNYQALNLEVSPGPVVLAGPNGAGKTNILEAISLFAPGRGLRGDKLSEITCHSHADQLGILWAASLRLDDETQLSTGLEKTAQGTEKRVYKIHGESVKGQGYLAEWLNILWLTPAVDRLFLEAPTMRRKFVDRLIYAQDPLHAERLHRYEQVLRERLFVLKNQKDPRWLSGLEEQLASLGVAIAIARHQLMQKLTQGQQYLHPLFPRFYTTMAGEVDEWIKNYSATEMESKLAEAFHQHRHADQESGTTKYGPHRSDWQVIHQLKNISADQASTGEQKILLAAVILSFIHAKTRQDPRLTILLLDDVIAHLDFHHRVVLFEQICALQTQQDRCSHVQTWLTGTDALLFETLIGQAQFFMIDQATITPG